MSLESNLELNNKLVAEQNTLLTQLLSAMARGKSFTPDTFPTPKVETQTTTRKGPFYWKHPESDSFGTVDTLAELENIISADDSVVEIHKVEYLQLKRKAAGENKPKTVALEAQPLEIAVALAVLYGADARTPSEAQIIGAATAAATPISSAESKQIDALVMALKGVSRAIKLHGAGVFELALQILAHWDELPGIAERREYASLLLDTPHDKRADVQPTPAGKKQKKVDPEPVPVTDTPADADPNTLFNKAEELILTLAKGGYLNEAKQILADHNAKKLTEITPADLPAVIAAAEKALEG
ncbi:hypothetical protein JZM24_04955 [Candidatus Sodalis endolongispinus]|uniref:Phage protein n=1 Tax=Candidatus Sodalis endolongispinus TaxID=2812662 RepID=A0ABS5YAD3_9GAMM|nr:hypothetical protein [Candidatus Sodalis endolongispinus]MBT9431657.1 hypothetical protein [Candidatus Sodalis endolongispinus]